MAVTQVIVDKIYRDRHYADIKLLEVKYGKMS
jgi:hypothetical protein